MFGLKINAKYKRIRFNSLKNEITIIMIMIISMMIISHLKTDLSEPTFQLADLSLTVRPLLVTVHFILMKKSRSVHSSLPFLPKPLPGRYITRWKNENYA